MCRRIAELEHANGRLRERLAAFEKERDDLRAEQAQALSGREQMLRAVLDAITETLVVLDSNGVIQAVNQTAADRLGCAKEDLVGRDGRDPACKILPPDVRSARLACVDEVVQTSTPMRITDRRDGRVFDQVYYPVINEQGCVTQVVVFAQDITARVKMEKELVESRQRYLDLVENVNDILYTADCDGNLLTVNRAVQRILGFDPQEIVGSHYRRWVPKEALARLEEARAEALDGRRATMEVALSGRDAGEHFLEVSLGPLVVEGKIVGTQGIIRDITDRRRAEQAVRENEGMLRALFDAVTESVLMLGRDGTMLMANETAARRFGKSARELIGGRMVELSSDIMPSEVVERRMARIREVVDTRVPVQFEDDRAGRQFFTSMYPILDPDGVVRRIAVFAKDVSDCRELERSLLESEERYRTVVESAGEAIAIVDEGGTFLFMNDTAARALGGKPSDFTRKTMWELFRKDIADRQAGAVRKVIHTGVGENSLVLSDVRGELRWYNTTVAPLRDRAGRVTAGLVIARDVHELRTTQQELQAYRERMMRAEQLASLGTLSATYAHELNQPLTVIRLSLQNALKDLDESNCPPTVLEDLNDGLAEISNISSIIERLRSLARQTSSGSVTKVILSVTAGRVMRLLEESARSSRVALRLERLGDLPSIYACEKDLEQLFFSLAQNAIQAADGVNDHCLRIVGAAREKEVELRFVDDCGGIDPAHIGRIFDPFFTTKREREGTGLGLCIVHRVVSAMGGRIHVDSRFGDGTTFIVTLPVEGK